MSKHEGRLITDVVTDAADALVSIRRWCEEKVKERGENGHGSGVSMQDRLNSSMRELEAQSRIAYLESHLSDFTTKLQELRRENGQLKQKSMTDGYKIADLEVQLSIYRSHMKADQLPTYEAALRKVSELREENRGLCTKLRQHDRSYESFLRAIEEARNER